MKNKEKSMSQLDRSLLQKQNKFFQSFEEKEVKVILDQGVINRYKEGEVIFWERDPGDTMFIVLTGQVEILLKEGEIEEVLAILGPGDIFGEGSFATKAPRTAKAMATKDTYVYVISANHLEKLMEKYPKIAAKMLLELLKTVCFRLHITNKRLSTG
ncbi:MAG: cyclic nucleotide-binding domain-containing protein [Planctomycetota bacterium]|nr:MAG: cyclic nucleotide-binding domain-containing protein [Planctomycetota bacterium]